MTKLKNVTDSLGYVSPFGPANPLTHPAAVVTARRQTYAILSFPFASPDVSAESHLIVMRETFVASLTECAFDHKHVAEMEGAHHSMNAMNNFSAFLKGSAKRVHTVILINSKNCFTAIYDVIITIVLHYI